jgi:thiamine biosynthesis protein ThiS
MKLIINGKETEILKTVTIKDLVIEKGLNPALVVVEHNYIIPERNSWETITLNEGDKLEILKFVGGG